MAGLLWLLELKGEARMDLAYTSGAGPGGRVVLPQMAARVL